MGPGMNRSALIALLLIPFAAAQAHGARIVQLALPTQQPEEPPRQSVGDPDPAPIISLDLFDFGSSAEEAWPWTDTQDED